MTDRQLHILISRYFDGETSLDEERALRAALSRLENPDSEAKEAMAVMGYATAVTPTDRSVAISRSKTRPLRVWGSCVAAALVAAALVTPLFKTQRLRGGGGECVAYVNGIRIDDTETVTAIMMNQLGEAANASDRIADNITDQWAEMAAAMDAIR